MKSLLFGSFLFILVACGRQSSPEGRSLIRDEQIQVQINFIKEQNKVMLDSLRLIHKELERLKDQVNSLPVK